MELTIKKIKAHEYIINGEALRINRVNFIDATEENLYIIFKYGKSKHQAVYNAEQNAKETIVKMADPFGQNRTGHRGAFNNDVAILKIIGGIAADAIKESEQAIYNNNKPALGSKRVEAKNNWMNYKKEIAKVSGKI